MNKISVVILILMLTACSEGKIPKSDADLFVKEKVLPVLRSLKKDELTRISCTPGMALEQSSLGEQIKIYRTSVGLLQNQPQIAVASDIFIDAERKGEYVATYKITAEFAKGKESIAVGLSTLSGGWCFSTIGLWPNA